MIAEIITIGDEILLGQIVDTNSAWMGQQLNLLDIAVKQITSISDKKETIYNSLKQASQRADLIIVTGGLGPTKDDVTKDTISAYFQSPLVRDEKVLLHVKKMFANYAPQQEMPISNYEQAQVLACAEVLFNDVGTAPGMWVEYEGKIYVFLPGVPFEMMFLMKNRVFPKLIDKNRTTKVYHAHIITVGLGESFLAEKIKDIEDRLPEHIKLAYLPRLGLVRLRLSTQGDNYDTLKIETDAFAKEIADRLADYFVTDTDITLEEAIVAEFSNNNLKVAFAESCTGGNLAGAITLIPGASQIFDCGIVAYENKIKTKVLGVDQDVLNRYGAVSEQTVIQMAEGIKKISNADYTIATSGIAGPGGGTADKPVGTVWIAVHGKNEIVTKKFEFKNDRKINIERTIAQALIMLWKLFKKECS